MSDGYNPKVTLAEAEEQDNVPHPGRFPGQPDNHAFVLAQADSRLAWSQDEAANGLDETRDQWFRQRNIREE